MNDSTAHFYVIINTILMWDVMACINFIFFPFLYYSSSAYGISNKKFMTLITYGTYFVEGVCATNLNWNTAILCMNRFVAIYFPYQFANLTNRNGAKGNSYLNYARKLFGHLFTLKKTRKSGILLMTLICLFSVFLSTPYIFYVDLKEGVRDINSGQNKTVVVLYREVSCDSKLSKNPIKFSYYYVMSKFFYSFSTHYDKFFSILVYLVPSLLILFSQISVFAKLKKLKRTINIQPPHVESIISTNIESNLTIPNQNDRPSQVSLKGQMAKNFNNSINSKIFASPTQTTTPIGSHLSKNAQNNGTTKSSKFYLDKYILTLAVGIEFLLLNLPYVIFVFVINHSWAEGASSTITKVQAIVYLLKYSNHSINVYINIIFNSSIRTLLMLHLNKWYESCITRIFIKRNHHGNLNQGFYIRHQIFPPQNLSI
ncbi:unnamed protein product [Gordionus sp. m RMFG-2023]